MSKRIIFCADGTWDSKSVTNPTNVYVLFKALANATDQLPLYDDGVGADGSPIDRLLGGAFGAGLFQKIKDGYTQIAHNYEDGDQVFIFGFSRGAYTARSLAGMIAVCGLPPGPLDPNDNTFVDTAFNAYRARDPNQRAAILASLANYRLCDARITMVGVWDTVGSLGIPAVFGASDPILCGFLDTSLHPDVMNAYHALAIDERRMEFPPTLWTGGPTAPGQVLEQVWFSGVHSDVGGGYGRPGLEDITLSWMASRAEALGVTFAPGINISETHGPEYALDPCDNSWNVGWGIPKSRSVPNGSSIGNSVSIKCQSDPGYRPSNIVLDGTGRPAAQYPIAQVVTPLAAAAAGGAAG